MKYYHIEFNGYLLNDFVDRIIAIRRDIMPPRFPVTQTVPGRTGVYLTDVYDSPRTIEVDIRLQAKDYVELREKTTALAGVLKTTKEAPLILGDEPDVVRMAVLESQSWLGEVGKFGRATLVFYQPDPARIESSEQQHAFNSNGQLSVLNSGTGIAYPAFRVTFNQPVTNFEIMNHTTEKSIKLGYPLAVEQTPIDPEELMIHDTMGSTSGWQQGVSVDGGTITGSFESEGGRFVVSNFGEGSAWHGPALRRQLDDPIQDFRVETLIQLDNTVGEVGRVEVYLFDINDNVIGKIALKDSWPSNVQNRGESRAGGLSDGHYILGEDYAGAWNDYDGMLRLQRQGNQWVSYHCKIRPNGEHHARQTVRWTDTQNQYTGSLHSVQVHIGTSGEYEPCDMAISEMRVYQLNQPEDVVVEQPYVAHSGDTVDIDTGLNRVLKNGEPMARIVDISSHDDFALERGYNDLEVFPKGVATTNVSWRKRWV